MIVNQKTSKLRTGLTLIEFLVVCAIIAILITMLLPATRTSRGPARRTQCKNNLKQIGIALHNYHDTYGSFPPAYTVDENGNRLHSWRTLILPFIDQAPLYETIDLTKAWDDPANAEAYGTTLPAFLCPSANMKPGQQTSYMAIVGENHAFSATTGREYKDFKRGTSNTVIIIEVDSSDAVHWMSPEDVDGDYLANLNEESPLSHEGGLNALLADGAVRFIAIEETQSERAEMVILTENDVDSE